MAWGVVATGLAGLTPSSPSLPGLFQVRGHPLTALRRRVDSVGRYPAGGRKVVLGLGRGIAGGYLGHGLGSRSRTRWASETISVGRMVAEFGGMAAGGLAANALTSGQAGQAFAARARADGPSGMNPRHPGSPRPTC